MDVVWNKDRRPNAKARLQGLRNKLNMIADGARVRVIKVKSQRSERSG
jgi:hypothetical protein